VITWYAGVVGVKEYRIRTFLFCLASSENKKGFINKNNRKNNIIFLVIKAL
jgi:hypothetical protein